MTYEIVHTSCVPTYDLYFIAQSNYRAVELGTKKTPPFGGVYDKEILILLGY